MNSIDDIYEKILKAIKEQRVSTKELAAKVGCSQRHIQYLLKGERQLGLETMDKVLKVLGLTLTIGAEEKTSSK